MKLLKETTVWETSTPNHIYIFDGSETKIAGYIPDGTTKAMKFSKPMMFDKRGRTFTPVKPDGFDLTAMKG